MHQYQRQARRSLNDTAMRWTKPRQRGSNRPLAEAVLQRKRRLPAATIPPLQKGPAAGHHYIRIYNFNIELILLICYDFMRVLAIKKALQDLRFPAPALSGKPAARTCFRSGGGGEPKF